MSYRSKAAEADWKYPTPAPYAQGHLPVGDGHEVYWHCYGNPDGEPVFYIHGGPGGGTEASDARVFDPARYRIVLFDQRGCGKSRPHVADDVCAALAHNTTAHLIADIEALRAHLGIAGRMHLFGGSWGSTLALAYSIAHPQHVATRVLRGIFLCRRGDLDFFFQGNAATYAGNPADDRLPGAYQLFPEAWKPFVEFIPPAQRADMVAAYSAIFLHPAQDAKDRARQDEAARIWSLWEGACSHLAADPADAGKFGDAKFAKAFARIENHYFMHGAFLGGTGRDNDHLLQHVGGSAHIPTWVVHGRYDMVCHLPQAEALVAALRAAGGQVDYRITLAGHSMRERENARALTAIMDDLPRSF